MILPFGDKIGESHEILYRQAFGAKVEYRRIRIHGVCDQWLQCIAKGFAPLIESCLDHHFKEPFVAPERRASVASEPYDG